VGDGEGDGDGEGEGDGDGEGDGLGDGLGALPQPRLIVMFQGMLMVTLSGLTPG
jgi:hypothetical protein